MLRKLYEKSQIWFAALWIVLYCVLMSVGDALSAMLGVEKSVTLAVGLILSSLLVFFIYKNRLSGRLGLCPSRVHPRKMLYYLPLVLMLSANAWFGLKINYEPIELVLYILSMICVGFLEEVIFRGLLFEAMRRDSFKAAVVVSSVTFGIGHIINLFNGSGAELLPNLLQVVYATSASFMFVMMYCKSGSLVGCIVAHALFNSLSAFSNDAAVTPTLRIISSVALTLITGLYALYLALTLSRDAEVE